jgi:ubiquinone/menaquinone biosynthesis C-methylase UbiE
LTYALDLSPGLLKAQAKHNPDLKQILNENICQTSLSDKRIDLTLMIDVIEHIPEPKKALAELKRITEYTIFNVPLERSVLTDIGDFLKKGHNKKASQEKFGHFNFYNSRTLNRILKKELGTIILHKYANSAAHSKSLIEYKKTSANAKILTNLSYYIFKLSPKSSSLIFGGSELLLVKSNIFGIKL